MIFAFLPTRESRFFLNHTAMKITEIIIKREPGNGNLLAYVDVVLDGVFMLRDVKLLRGSKGRYNIQMPDRQRTIPCPHCINLNPFNANFCNLCGAKLANSRALMASTRAVAIIRVLDPEWLSEFRRKIVDQYKKCDE